MAGDQGDEVPHGCCGAAGVDCGARARPGQRQAASGRRKEGGTEGAAGRREGIQGSAREDPGTQGKVRSVGGRAACGTGQEAEITSSLQFTLEPSRQCGRPIGLAWRCKMFYPVLRNVVIAAGILLGSHAALAENRVAL